MSTQVRGHHSAPVCCLPGCAETVTVWGQVCAGCVREFGYYLAPERSGSDMTGEQLADALADRDRETASAYAAQAETARAGEQRTTADRGREEYSAAVRYLAKRQLVLEGQLTAQLTEATANTAVQKANQRCWMCENRRLCTLIQGRWECADCQGIS